MRIIISNLCVIICAFAAIYFILRLQYAARMERITIPFYAQIYESRIAALAAQKDSNGLRLLHTQIARHYHVLSLQRQYNLLQKVEQALSSIKYTR